MAISTTGKEVNYDHYLERAVSHYRLAKHILGSLKSLANLLITEDSLSGKEYFGILSNQLKYVSFYCLPLGTHKTDFLSSLKEKIHSVQNEIETYIYPRPLLSAKDRLRNITKILDDAILTFPINLLINGEIKPI